MVFKIRKRVSIDEIRNPLCWSIRGALRMKFPDIAPQIAQYWWGRSGYLRYINNNALQISQHGRYLLSSIVKKSSID